MNPAHQQRGHSIRFDWGLTGASAVGSDAGVAVVVDVLSFTTTLSVAADRGTEVYPYRWQDDSAGEYAADRDAVLAVSRHAAADGEVSLSPGTVRSAGVLERLVLPSPNGSSIAHSLAAASGVCVGAALRNASAVASWIAENHVGGTAIAVIAAGERWRDGTLRPAAEDVWGAGAVIAKLLALRPDLDPSPEAEMASATWLAVSGRVGEALERCASGRELVASGYRSDVVVAAEVDASWAVPVLVGDRFLNRSPGS
ncbi:2-phosphosulfolactate phosphatase [Rhodococcus sp. RD6.2]|uniref:2-phosphosulfolactate phosphatase n=1 Tax=Rhodococcus sp. RD6.2 TaxID=260936 RepID=UPI00063B59FA|nr:2-phosphosulfolactate phosphatase [Rhodococcus sp. RD6.2]CRK51387.1 2-phosphosulfolactate phosphatase [Rhodococcus sp. RD6.2]